MSPHTPENTRASYDAPPAMCTRSRTKSRTKLDTLANVCQLTGKLTSDELVSFLTCRRALFE